MKYLEISSSLRLAKIKLVWKVCGEIAFLHIIGRDANKYNFLEDN